MTFFSRNLLCYDCKQLQKSLPSLPCLSLTLSFSHDRRATPFTMTSETTNNEMTLNHAPSFFPPFLFLFFICLSLHASPRANLRVRAEEEREAVVFPSPSQGRCLRRSCSCGTMPRECHAGSGCRLSFSLALALSLAHGREGGLTNKSRERAAVVGPNRCTAGV